MLVGMQYSIRVELFYAILFTTVSNSPSVRLSSVVQCQQLLVRSVLTCVTSSSSMSKEVMSLVIFLSHMEHGRPWGLPNRPVQLSNSVK